MIRFLCLFQLTFILAQAALVWADTTGSVTAAPTATVTAKSRTNVTAVQTPAVKKDFQWFLKNGCNCAQCRAARQQQADDQERLKEIFQP